MLSMDVEAGEVDFDAQPMTIDRFQQGEQRSDDDDQEGDTWLNNLILQTQLDMEHVLFEGKWFSFSCWRRGI